MRSDLKSLSSYGSGASGAGILAGDPVVRQMISELTSIIRGTISRGVFATLPSVGINTKLGVG
jgi:flagellar capping protein FliD